MSLSTVDAIERSTHKTNEWLSELAAELGQDREDAERAARAATKLLRERVTEGEWEDVLSQLPTEVRELLVHD